MSSFSLSEFADKINEIMPILIKEFAKRQTNELYRGKITLPQFLILGFLDREGELKMTPLADFMGVSTAAMTGIVDRLVRNGYVIRAYDPRDRRVIKIKLTNKGSELVKKIDRQRRQMIIKIFSHIPPIERETYLRVLMRIKEILSK